jgi:hypothetical protein
VVEVAKVIQLVQDLLVILVLVQQHIQQHLVELLLLLVEVLELLLDTTKMVVVQVDQVAVKVLIKVVLMDHTSQVHQGKEIMAEQAEHTMVVVEAVEEPVVSVVMVSAAALAQKSVVTVDPVQQVV